MIGKKSKGRFIPLIVLLMLLSLLFVPQISISTRAEEENPMRIELTGGRAVAAGDTVDFMIGMYGGPAESGVAPRKWTYQTQITAENWTGLPSIEPSSGNTTDHMAKITLTAPTYTQTLKITVKATSMNGTHTRTHERTFKIRIVEPVILEAKVRNPSDVDAENIPVYFYANGGLIGTKLVNVSAQNTSTVKMNWVTYSDGKYTIKVAINPMGSFVELENGNNVMTKDLYINTDQKNYTPIYAFTVVVMALILLMMYGKTRKKIRGY